MATAPEGVTLRMLEFTKSATKRVPVAASTAMPEGVLKPALLPKPSAKPPEALPARVLTAPAGVTLRIRLFMRSETYRMPLEASTAMPLGLLNLALVPVPSAVPENCEGDPARLATAPAGLTERSLLLFASQM